MKPVLDQSANDSFVDLAREPDFTLGTIHVRPSAREITVRDRSEVLEPRVMQVLVVLARAEGVVVSRDALLQRCWEGRAVGNDALNRCIAKVRALAKTDPAHSYSIETIRGVGYRLTVTHAGPTVRKRARIYAAAIALAGALLVFAAWRWWTG